jgi:hypothetical protein
MTLRVKAVDTSLVMQACLVPKHMLPALLLKSIHCIFCLCRHPWFSRPLPEKYETALAQLQEEQRAIDARVAGGNYRSKERDAQLQVNHVLA